MYKNNLIYLISRQKRGQTIKNYWLNRNSLAQISPEKLVLASIHNYLMLEKITCHLFKKWYHRCHWRCTRHKLIDSILLLHFKFHGLCFQPIWGSFLNRDSSILILWFHRLKNTLLLLKSIHSMDQTIKMIHLNLNRQAQLSLKLLLLTLV